MRAIKPRRWFVQRDIQMLIRTFPSESIAVFRGVRTFGSLGQTVRWNETNIVYRGEALVIPATGAVADYGLGQVENKNPQLLISGNRDIEQGDFVRYQNRKYQVEFEPNHWHAFLQITLAQFQQGA
jgi:hypothetical protein